MFESFFPKPKLFFSSLIVWIAFLIASWYLIGFELGLLLGFNLTEGGTDPVIGLGHFITPEFLWFDFYYFIGTLVFASKVTVERGCVADSRTGVCPIQLEPRLHQIKLA